MQFKVLSKLIECRNSPILAATGPTYIWSITSRCLKIQARNPTNIHFLSSPSIPVFTMSCQIMSNAIYEKSRIGMRDIKKFLAAIYRGSSYAADLRSQSSINLELERPERERNWIMLERVQVLYCRKLDMIRAKESTTWENRWLHQQSWIMSKMLE